VDLVLVKDWNGLPTGFELVGVQDGQAELMIQKGFAVPSQKTEPKQKQKRSK